MTDYQISLNGEQVKDLLINDDGLKGLVEEVLSQVLEVQMTEHVGAARHERSPERSERDNS